MRPDRKVYDALARLVTYPRPGFSEAVEEWTATVTEACPAAAAPLERFRAFLAECDDNTVEELYARTFDNNQAAALEVGWHLYGEAYERGAFMVRMREQLRDHGVAESSELPDHLTMVLSLIGCSSDEISNDLAGKAAIPAVRKVATSLAAGDNPYEAVLDAVLEVLTMHVQESNGCC